MTEPSRTRPVPTTHRRPMRVAVAVAMVAVALAIAACGQSNGQVQEIVVPAGTQARLDRGEEVVVMPSRLEFRVGDTLRIRNDDVVDQSVGPYWVAAGESLELTYGAPGRFEGFCPLSEGERYEIVVTR